MTTLPVGATEQVPGRITRQAGENLSAFQFMAVTLESDGQVDAYNAITDVPFGVLQNKPDTAGKAAEIVYSGLTKVEFGATVATGAQISFDSSAKAVTFVKDTDSTTFSAGQCVLGGSSGEIGMAIINTSNPPSGEE